MKELKIRDILSLILSLSFCSSCSTSYKNKAAAKLEDCKNATCEVEQYENLLQKLGTVESELQNGNSFKALNELERIKPQAYYHGRFKSLYKIAQETCFKSTNEMSTQGNSCSIVRERVQFIKTISPDKLAFVYQAVSNCNIDVSSNTSLFNFDLKGESIELSKEEFSNSNLYETAMKLKESYDSNPWEKLLLIDLKILASYQFLLGKPSLSKEMPHNKVRLLVPVEIEQLGSKTSYCPQYKSALHDKTFSKKINCFDYPEWSDHLAGVWRDSTGPHKWTDGTYLTEIYVTNETSKFITELPFTKGFRKLLSLDIKYASGKTKEEILKVDYPGDKIPHNLMARLAYTQMLSSKVGSPDNAGTILKAESPSGIVLTLYQSGVWGYELKIDVPTEMTKDIDSVALRIPIQSIRDSFYETSAKEISMRETSYGE